MRIGLFAALFFLSNADSSTIAAKAGPSDSDQLKIWLELGSSPNQFRVVIANTSSTPVKIWKEQCSWGYNALSLEAKGTGAPPRSIKPKAISWRRNLPQTRILAAGEKHELTFKPDDWPGLLTQGQDRVEIRAHYLVARDEEAIRAQVWTGHIQSEWVELAFGPLGQTDK